jgi:hypothetical protein
MAEGIMGHGQNMVVLYGVAPSDTGPMPPRDPFQPVEPNADAPLWLVPCPMCNRHIQRGTECPFCLRAEMDALKSAFAGLSVKLDALRNLLERQVAPAPTRPDLAAESPAPAAPRVEKQDPTHPCEDDIFAAGVAIDNAEFNTARMLIRLIRLERDRLNSEIIRLETQLDLHERAAEG